MDLKSYVTIVPDYPKEGISFKDITTIMDNGDAYKYATDQIVEFAKQVGTDIIVGPEARGFIIGCPVAYALEVGFAPVRKPGKLPRETIAVEYDLEYGKDSLTIHKDAIKPGQRVLIVDDLLSNRRHGKRDCRASGKTGRSRGRLCVPDRAIVFRWP